MYIYITENYLVQFLRIFTATETLHERRFHSKINFRYKNKSLKQQLPDENQGDLLISHHHHQELNWWVKLVQLRGFSFVVIPPFLCEKLKKNNYSAILKLVFFILSHQLAGFNLQENIDFDVSRPFEKRKQFLRIFDNSLKKLVLVLRATIFRKQALKKKFSFPKGRESSLFFLQ